MKTSLAGELLQEVWVVTKFKWVPNWSQKAIQIEPLGALGLIFWDFVRFWKDVFFLWVFGSAKSLPEIAKFINVGRQIEQMWFVWSGSAGEAACWGRERIGVLKIEDHLLSDLARRTEVGGGSECAMRREHRRPPFCSSAFRCIRLLQLLARCKTANCDNASSLSRIQKFSLVLDCLLRLRKLLAKWLLSGSKVQGQPGKFDFSILRVT